jgi:hypothetical protein
MSTLSANAPDLLDKNYRDALRVTVSDAIAHGALSVTELCRNSRGAFPTYVVTTAREIVGDGFDEWPRRRWPDEALGTEDAAVPSMPEPHPIDYEWRYTAESADSLAALSNELGGRVACFGTPSVFVRLMQGGVDAVLFDRNPGLRRHFPAYLHNRMQTLDLSHLPPGSDMRPGSMQDSFDTILLDPPWYVDHTVAWVAHALQLLRPGGRIVLTLFPELVRPAAHRERQQLLHLLGALGIVKKLTATARYTTPIFESETLSTFGLADLGQWRSADLIQVTVRDPRSHTIAPPPTEDSSWQRFQLGRQVIALRHQDSTRGLPLSVRSCEENGSFLLRSVSARDPIRKRVNFWTSRNRAEILSGTKTLSVFLS